MMKMQGNTTEIDERNLLRLDALLSHGYGLSPQLVMRSKGLSIEAKALYSYLSSFAGAGDTAFPSTSRILEELDISKNRFYKIRNNLDYGKVPSYMAYERPADIGTTIIDELCASQGTAVEKLVNYPTTKFERTMRDELFEALAVNETTISLMAKVPSSVFLDAVACMDSRYMSGHTVDTGHAFIVSPGTYEPYIGIHDPVYGAGYMMVDLDKPFEIPMNRIWIAMDDYSGPETKEGLRGMYHSPQDVSAFSDPFCGSVSVTPTRDEKQKPAKSGLEAKRDACAISAAHLDSPNTEIPDGKNMERE